MNLFLIALEAKIKVLADSVSGERPFLDLQTIIFLVSSHGKERGREREISGVPSNKIINPIMRAPPYDLIYI